MAAALGLEKSTCSRLVDNLIQQGLLIKENDTQDRRSVNIRITESGYNTVNNIGISMEDYYARVFNCIPEQKKGQLLESLELLNRVLNDAQCCSK